MGIFIVDSHYLKQRKIFSNLKIMSSVGKFNPSSLFFFLLFKFRLKLAKESGAAEVTFLFSSSTP